jgi:dTDP-4-dehydrorhamnose reductase
MENDKTRLLELQFLSHKRILVTGCEGMLGGAFIEMINTYVPESVLFAYSHKQLDVTDRDSVNDRIEDKPDIIIHCAGKVDAEYCETNLVQAHNVFIEGVNNIISLAKKTKAKLFFPQSFLIFDGKEQPIIEDTVPNPLCAYGKLKFDSEKKILNQLSDFLIVRMGGFFGGYEKDKNFVGKFAHHISKLLREGKTEQEVGDRVWQPTHINDLAYNSLLLLAENTQGIYNMSSLGQASFYDIACEMIHIFDLEKHIQIQKVAAEKFMSKEKARRPVKAIMSNKRLIEEGLNRQRQWKQSLCEYLQHDYFRRLFS